jgi:hypothetical protein
VAFFIFSEGEGNFLKTILSCAGFASSLMMHFGCCVGLWGFGSVLANRVGLLFVFYFHF